MAWVDPTNFGFYSDATQFCDSESDYGKYRNKSNEIPLQLPKKRSIFPVTIPLTRNVIEYLSNYTARKVITSKYFPNYKFVINYLSKYISITTAIVIPLTPILIIT